MADEPLTPDEQTAIADEEALLRRVQAELAKVIARPAGSFDFDAELIALRDQLGETAAEDHAMLVEHMTRLSALRAAQDREYAMLADPQNPYFAHLRLTDVKDGAPRVRDVLIGRRAFIDNQRGVSIVDWRNSPISRIYYCYEQGDEYEERIAGALKTGRVTLRRTLNIADGRLMRMREGEAVLVRDEAGDWRRLAAERSQLAGGVGVATRAPSDRLGRHGADQRLPEITALIDPEQFRIISDPRTGVVVVRGGAGTGKTTIALHRVAFLHFTDRKRFNAKRMLVITPGEALRRYVSSVLPALDVGGVPIRTFPAWARDSVKRLIPAMAGRDLTDDTPSGARRLKRLPIMVKLIEEAVQAQARGFDEVFAEAGGPALLDAWVRRRNLHSVPRLDALERWLRETPEGRDVLDEHGVLVKRALERARAELSDPVEVWAGLMTDRTQLGDALTRHGVPFSDWELEQLVDVVGRQADDPEDLSHIDQDRRMGVDGFDVLEGDIRGHLDVDDLAALLRVCQLQYGRLAGPSGRSLSYEHIMVDEAQDLPPLSLAVLCGAARPKTPVTLAGDTAQRLSLDTGFGDWKELIGLLRLDAHVLPPLAISYRSTRQVMALARHVLGPLATEGAARDARDGAPVELLRFDETGEAVAFLADALKSLRTRERRSSVALIARTPEVADLYFQGLERAEVPALRRIRQQEFDFTPGIDVTDVYQIKGLEYDYVVLLEPTARHYPDALEARHLLHVAATRAAHQLWLITSETPSPLLPAALLEGRGLDADDGDDP
ncbi:MAG: ATP-binding domain-containing protein [Myxococcales bacterium]|nr:ATP-binding domain-containing protein [Myxococcales bacterium]